jgi:hypothetical protein
MIKSASAWILRGLAMVMALVGIAAAASPPYPPSFFRIGIAVYFVFLAYLVWFRLSSRATGQVSAVLAIAIYAYLSGYLRGLITSGKVPEDPWHAVFIFGGLLVTFWIWLFLWASFDRLLFSDGASGQRRRKRPDSEPKKSN